MPRRAIAAFRRCAAGVDWGVRQAGTSGARCRHPPVLGGLAMRSVVRRSLVLLTVLAVLAMATVTAPLAAANAPTDTTVAGINVDATTIPELESAMDAGHLSSVELVRFYLKRISQLN